MPYHRLVRYENESDATLTPMPDALHDFGADILEKLGHCGYFERPAEWTGWNANTRLERTILELGEQLGLIRWEEDDRHA